MAVENNFTILIVLGVLLLLFSILTLVMLIVLCIMVSGLKKNQRVSSVQPNYSAGRAESVVQRNVSSMSTVSQQGTNAAKVAEKQAGQVICRSCYAAVFENQEKCPCCMNALDRR